MPIPVPRVQLNEATKPAPFRTAGVTPAARPPRGATPTPGAWRDRFPVGAYIGSLGDLDQRDDGNATTTTPRTFNAAAHIDRILFHPEQGVAANGFRDIAYAAIGNVDAWETTNAIPATIEAISAGDSLALVAGVGGTLSGGAGTGVDNDWFMRSSVNQTDSDADAFVSALFADQPTLLAHPSILWWNFGDDITPSNGQAWATLMRAWQRYDPYGRPCLGTVVDTAVWDLVPDAELRAVATYRYPCGKRTGGVVDLVEGDFHRESFSAYPDLGGGGGDWVDAIRHYTTAAPDATRVYLYLQTHETANGALHYPTDNELKKQFWIAVGESDGLFWFTVDGPTTGGYDWSGIGNADRLTNLGTIGALSSRLTPRIRAILADCARPGTDEFTISGGGSSGYFTNYSNGYISTRIHNITGDRYVTVCNHGTSTANVTISSSTHSNGRLVNLETGIAYRLGESFSLGPLDGTIFRWEDWYGVPVKDPDLGITAEQWWDGHWINPASANYVAQSAVRTWPNVVTLSGTASLQAAVNAAPDYTTFVLAAGYVQPSGETLNLIGRSHLHFVAADPLNKPTLRRLVVYGCERISRRSAYDSLLSGMAAKNDQDIYDWFHPKSDFYFRDLHFVSDGQLIDQKWYRIQTVNSFPNYIWAREGIAEGMPIWLRNVRDVLVEGCVFDGYEMASERPQPAPTDLVDTFVPNNVDTPNQFHAAFISGNSGLANIWARNCLFHAKNDTRGMPWAFFLDGVQGGGVVSCVLPTGRLASGCYGGLTNDDYVGDYDYDGTIEDPWESRSSRHFVVYDCDLPFLGTPISVTGARVTVVGNRLNGGGGTLGHVVTVAARCSSKNQPANGGHVYRHYDHYVANNTITIANLGTLVDLIVDDGLACQPNQPATYAYRGRIGRVTYENNAVSGHLTSGQWVLDRAGSVAASDGPNIDGGGNTHT